MEIPAFLQHGVPRDVRFTAGGRALYIAAVAMLVASVAAGVVLNARGVQEADERRLLTESGVRADAVVLRLWRASGEQKQPWVAYRFTVGERGYGGQAKISLTKWRGLQVGAVLPIRYVPERLDLNAPADTERRALPLWVPFLAATPLALGGLTILFVIRADRQLLANGRPAAAVVTQHHKHSSSHGGTHRSMTYEFRVLSGAAATGKSSTSKNAPAIGSVIYVVYDPERPRRNKPYPFQLVRANVE